MQLCHHPIDAVQIQHLLRIGYTAGRRAADAPRTRRRAFDARNYHPSPPCPPAIDETWLAHHLRGIADCIDDAGAPKAIGCAFTWQCRFATASRGWRGQLAQLLATFVLAVIWPVLAWARVLALLP